MSSRSVILRRLAFMMDFCFSACTSETNGKSLFGPRISKLFVADVSIHSACICAGYDLLFEF